MSQYTHGDFTVLIGKQIIDVVRIESSGSLLIYFDDASTLEIFKGSKFLFKPDGEK